MKAERVHSGQFYPGTPFALQMALHSPYAILNPFTEGFSIDPCSSYYIYPSKVSFQFIFKPRSLNIFYGFIFSFSSKKIYQVYVDFPRNYMF